ncbi:Potassium-transporting ATPase C chain [gamma proteobacterium HdN1]|nr:Potassium-transporting ATPase C chain [gamma proteobacterium HdN1]
MSPSPAATLHDGGALRGSLALAAIALAGFGFLYSLAGVGIGQTLFPDTANGSLLHHNSAPVGSSLVAQPFAGDGYFQPRPSAASYNPMAMSGSNQARTNPDLRARLAETRLAVAQRNGVAPESVPGELYTQSGSGMDPHVSPQGAAIQIDRVARERGLEPQRVKALVNEYTEAKQFGVFGQPRVHILHLNMALDAITTGTAATTEKPVTTGKT